MLKHNTELIISLVKTPEQKNEYEPYINEARVGISSVDVRRSIFLVDAKKIINVSSSDTVYLRSKCHFMDIFIENVVKFEDGAMADVV